MHPIFYIVCILVLAFGIVPLALYIWVRIVLKAKNDEKIDYLKKLKGACDEKREEKG